MNQTIDRKIGREIKIRNCLEKKFNEIKFIKDDYQFLNVLKNINDHNESVIAFLKIMPRFMSEEMQLSAITKNRSCFFIKGVSGSVQSVERWLASIQASILNMRGKIIMVSGSPSAINFETRFERVTYEKK